MGDFRQLSDTDESAVEELITQAKDLSLLDQLAKINTCGFTDSSLPSDLESRFRKLKSFPVSTSHNPKPKSSLDSKSTHLDDSFSENKRSPDKKTKLEKETGNGYVASQLNSSISEEKLGLEKKLEVGFGSSPSGSSSNSWLENIISSPSNSKQKKRNLKQSRSFRETSSNSSSSPPAQSGCFWCSPKKDSKKKSNGKQKWSLDGKLKRKEEDELLDELGVISLKEQEKIMKKVMKEQEKFNKEAEKIVKWAKQASANLSSYSIEDEFSDDDSN